ncbi:MAG: O-antigen ligase family protein, partial [Myxococcota bacterium]
PLWSFELTGAPLSDLGVRQREPRRHQRSREGMVLLVLALVAMVIPGSRAGFEGWAALWLTAVAVWLASAPGWEPRPLVRWLVLAAALQAALALVGELWDPQQLSEWVPFRGRRALGTFGNPTLLGIWLAAALPLCFVRPERVAGHPTGTGMKGWLAALLVVAGTLACRSRVAIGLLVIGALAMVSIRAPRLRIGCVLAGLSATGLGWALGYGDAAWNERWSVVKAVIEGMSDRGYLGWLTGIGAEGFTNHWPLWRERQDSLRTLALRHAHNDPLEWTVDFGLLGAGLFVALVALAGKGLRSHADIQRLAGLSLGLLLIGGLMQPTLVGVPGAIFAGAMVAVVLFPKSAAHPRGYTAAALGLVAALLLGLMVLRCTSEWQRGRATILRVQGRDSLEAALAAARIDASNDRAWLEVAMARDAEEAIRRVALEKVRVKGLSRARSSPDEP